MNAKRKPNKIINGVEYRHCTKCGAYKPLSAFNANIRTQDGLRCSCKDCDRKARKPYVPKKHTNYIIAPGTCAACKSFSPSEFNNRKSGWCMSLRRNVRYDNSCPRFKAPQTGYYEHEVHQVTIYPGT